MVLLIDNYDSFSYNLYQMIGSITSDIRVIRNDEMTIEEIEQLAPERIVVSPGPGRPSKAGICEKAIQYFAGKVPILGVCLGHQAICEVYGATITYAKELMHGKQSVVDIDTDSPIFKGLELKEKVARYHSLAVDPSSVPEQLSVIAKLEENQIMAVKHRDYEVYGLQFHPESILTPSGEAMIKNFIKGE